MHPDLVPYHLECEQPDLMPDLGPPDFYPLVPVSLASLHAGQMTDTPPRPALLDRPQALSCAVLG